MVHVLQALQQDRDAPTNLLADLTPLQVEAFALTVILFLGVQSAAALLIEPDRPDAGARTA